MDTDAEHRPQGCSRLDDILPRFHFRERHSRLVAASPHQVSDALRSVTLREMLLVPLLLTLRSLPATLAGKEGLPGKRDEPLLTQMLAGGFTLLAEDPDEEIVVGAIGKMWKPAGAIVRVADGAAFRSFDRPGYVKVAMNLRTERCERGTRLSTETRVLATSRGSRRRFALYWLLIRGGSAAIRRSWLRAVARRTERSVERGDPSRGHR